MASPRRRGVDTARAYSLGYAMGQNDRNTPGTQDNLVILAFGMPVSQPSYGTSLFGQGPASTSQIAAAVEQFGRGYYLGVQSDVNSTLLIAVGTSNYGTNVTQVHGQAWGS